MVIYLSEVEMDKTALMSEDGVDCKTVRDIAPVWTLWILPEPTTLSKKSLMVKSNINLENS